MKQPIFSAHRAKREFEAKKQNLIKTFTGWMKVTEGHESWSARSQERYYAVNAIRFQNGQPVEIIRMGGYESRFGCGDMGYGQRPYNEETKANPEADTSRIHFTAVYTCRTRDNGEHEIHEYRINGIEFSEDETISVQHLLNPRGVLSQIHVMYPMIEGADAKARLAMAIRNPTAESISKAIELSPDSTSKISEAIGEERFYRIIGGMVISRHIETVVIPTHEGLIKKADPAELWSIPSKQWGVTKYLKVVDSTKRKFVFIPVEPILTDSRAALAWTFGMDYATYSQLHLQS